MELEKRKVYFSYYLLFLFLSGVFFLWFKHTAGSDSSISEWLINYQGGFTRRGLVGDIAFNVANFLNLDLRDTIFVFQSLIYFIFIYLIFDFFKEINFSYIFCLAIFTPIFILYPIAEIEVLGRKETFVFVFFILLLNISSFRFNENYSLRFVFFILPVICLIWEPVAFFFPFIMAILFIRMSNKKNILKFFNIFISFLPSFLILYLIIKFPLSDQGHEKMVFSLKENFNEYCYMSCDLLKSKAGVIKQFTDNIPAYYWPDGSFRESVFIRYFLIFVIGFGPLWILGFFSKLKKKIIILNKNYTSLLPILLILISPVLVLFAAGYDWGRWINISYTFSVLFYFYLVKNNLIKIDLKKIDKFLKKQNKKIVILFFIIFAFGWNPKTVVTGDIASFPGYRIPVKIVKFTIWKINN